MSDRVFALACLGACVLIVVQMWNLDVPIVYEPVGPKAFPILLALLMIACCAVLLASPDRGIHWPEARVLGKSAALVAVLLAYASLFEVLGFPLATSAMVIVASRIFGGRMTPSLIAGVLIGVLGYVFFDRILQVTLPLGRIWA